MQIEWDKIGVLIIGHGSREENSNREFEAFVDEYRHSHSDRDVRLAYIELAKPDVKGALLELSKAKSTIVILPLFLFTSGHIKNDIPLVIHEVKERFPEHRFLLANTLGMEPEIVQLMLERTKQAAPQDFAEKKKSGVIVVGRGASDVDANGEFYKVVRFFQEGGNYGFVFPAFIGITTPLLHEALEIAARLRPERLFIFPYFLFGGKLIGKIKKITESFSLNYPWIKITLAPYFGPDPKIFSTLDEKIKDALLGRKFLPCVTCEYRKQMPGLPNKVGGMKALLWSLRHMETHNQAAPHEFPHKNLRKHILVCQNVDCVNQGSILLVNRMRALIKKLGKQVDFRITRTSCMGRCGEGPTVVIYPDGIWYRKVQVSDADDLVCEHLLQDRIVSRLVDNIMQ